ncbi:hypothetical protein PR048_033411 [Dryococelus australis]|uniref:Uncharacterized protein n=1 Tax=Dryococelus australis TaxID=614101 RepID=A0ABQ9G3J1_9NEOP|nr:hypothetical protein PR048_033411 [Dryococelus australis]
MLDHSSHSTVAADNQWAVYIGIFVHKIVEIHFTVLNVPKPESFFHWLLRRCQAASFLNQPQVIGAHNCEVFNDWRSVTQGVSGIVCSNDRGIAKCGSPLVDDRPIMNAVKYRAGSGVVWTNSTMASSNTDTNRTGVLAVVDIETWLKVRRMGGVQRKHLQLGGRGVTVDRQLASHQGEPGSLPGRGPSRFFARGNRSGQCRWSEGFVGDIAYPRPWHSGAAPYTTRDSPSSALKTSLLRTTHISSLFTHSRMSKRKRLGLRYNLKDVKVKIPQPPSLDPHPAILSGDRGADGCCRFGCNQDSSLVGFWAHVARNRSGNPGLRKIRLPRAGSRYLSPGGCAVPHAYPSRTGAVLPTPNKRHSRRRVIPMRVIEVDTEQRRNERAEGAGDPRENPPTNGIVQHDSHVQKSGLETTVLCTDIPMSTAHWLSAVTVEGDERASVLQDVSNTVYTNGLCCGGGMVKMLASHRGETGSIPVGVVSGIFVRVIVRAAGRRIFSGISRFYPLWYSGAAPCSTRLTLIGSRDIDLYSGLVYVDALRRLDVYFTFPAPLHSIIWGFMGIAGLLLRCSFQPHVAQIRRGGKSLAVPPPPPYARSKANELRPLAAEWRFPQRTRFPARAKRTETKGIIPWYAVPSRTLASPLGEPGSISGGFAFGEAHVGIVVDDAAGWWVFSGISRLPRPSIPALLHAHLASPSSALKISLSPLHATPHRLRAVIYLCLTSREAVECVVETHMVKDKQNSRNAAPIINTLESCVPITCGSFRKGVARYIRNSQLENDAGSGTYSTVKRSLLPNNKANFACLYTWCFLDKDAQNNKANFADFMKNEKAPRQFWVTPEMSIFAAFSRTASQASIPAFHAERQDSTRGFAARNHLPPPPPRANQTTLCDPSLPFGSPGLENSSFAALLTARQFSVDSTPPPPQHPFALPNPNPLAPSDLSSKAANPKEPPTPAAHTHTHTHTTLSSVGLPSSSPAPVKVTTANVLAEVNTDLHSTTERVAVAGRLHCPPPTKGNRVQSPAGSLPDFSQVGIVPDNASGRRVFFFFSGISRLPRPFIPVLLHTHLTSPLSVLKTSLLTL